MKRPVWREPAKVQPLRIYGALFIVGGESQKFGLRVGLEVEGVVLRSKTAVDRPWIRETSVPAEGRALFSYLKQHKPQGSGLEVKRPTWRELASEGECQPFPIGKGSNKEPS